MCLHQHNNPNHLKLKMNIREGIEKKKKKSQNNVVTEQNERILPKLSQANESKIILCSASNKFKTPNGHSYGNTLSMFYCSIFHIRHGINGSDWHLHFGANKSNVQNQAVVTGTSVQTEHCYWHSSSIIMLNFARFD